MNAPKPGPRPGQNVSTSKRPTPATVAGAASPTAPAAATGPDYADPQVAAKFGRIDDDGAVWLTGPPERQIGVWQAGTPEEGLAHFGRRYANVATEVGLLDARLESHPEEVERISADATRIQESLPTADILGDVPALDTRLAGILERAGKVVSQAAQRREELTVEAERIAAEGENWKADGDRMRAIVDEWRTLGGGERVVNDALWKRIRTARESFNQRRGAHFADLDKQRGAVKRRKQDLVARAVAMQDSTDWNETARAYRDLMGEWKAAGRAQRADDDRLWAQFRAAQDHFFGAKDADNRRKDAEFEDNAVAKQALLDEYDAKIDPESGLDRAREVLRELQEKFDEIGFVPRARVREFDEKIGVLESRVADFAEQQWRRTDPEVEARVAQFQAKVDQLRSSAEDAEKAGRAKKAAELRDQADQWAEWAKTAAQAAED